MKKIELIDRLLEDDEMLDKYINNLEHNTQSIPYNLNKKILTSINDKKINNKKSSNNMFFDILKVAACTTFVLILWQFVFSNPTTYATTNTDIKESEVYENIDNIIKKVSEFLKSPLNFERGNEK